MVLLDIHLISLSRASVTIPIISPVVVVLAICGRIVNESLDCEDLCLTV